MTQELARKHSLWLTLPDLQPTVDELAREAGNPAFIPHMTLVGNYQGTSREAMTLAQRISVLFSSQLSIDFSGFDTRYEEFRFFCFLARPSYELDRLYECTHESYKPAPQEPFRGWPHVSLLYGTESAKKAFPDLDELKARYGNTLDGIRNFSEISIVGTNGSVESWNLVGLVALTLGSSLLQ